MRPNYIPHKTGVNDINKDVKIKKNNKLRQKVAYVLKKKFFFKKTAILSGYTQWGKSGM